jgi:hypothetical protein
LTLHRAVDVLDQPVEHPRLRQSDALDRTRSPCPRGDRSGTILSAVIYTAILGGSDCICPEFSTLSTSPPVYDLPGSPTDFERKL